MIIRMWWAYADRIRNLCINTVCRNATWRSYCCIAVSRQSWGSCLVILVFRGTLCRVRFLWWILPGTGRLWLPVPRLTIGIVFQTFCGFGGGSLTAANRRHCLSDILGPSGTGRVPREPWAMSERHSRGLRAILRCFIGGVVGG